MKEKTVVNNKILRFGFNEDHSFIEQINEKIRDLFEKSKEDAGVYVYVFKPLLEESKKLKLSKEKLMKMLHNVFPDNKTVFDIKPVPKVLQTIQSLKM